MKKDNKIHYDLDFDLEIVNKYEEREVFDVCDMLDQDFLDPNLPDDFCYEMISHTFKEDPLVKVLTDPVYYQDVEMSRVVVCDYSENVIHVGPKNLSEPIYMPKEDFTSADMVLDYADDIRKGIYREFPDCPMPKPIIPENQYYKPETCYMLETSMALMGAITMDPSYGLQSHLTDYPMCQIEREVGLENLYDLKKRYTHLDAEFFFLPFHDCKDHRKYEGLRYIAMQFNPFHPMAIHFIKSFKWEGMVVSGTYSYRERDIRFLYDVNDTRYRIHSHIWLQSMKGYKFSGAMEVFDMVGNFDFNVLLKYVDKEVFVEPLIIEPMISRGPIKEYPPYSIFGRGNKFQRGVGDISFCPYANFFLEEQGGNVWVSDITDDVTVHCSRFFLTYRGETYKFKKKELQSDHLYFKWYDDKRYKCYVLLKYIGVHQGVVSYQKGREEDNVIIERKESDDPNIFLQEHKVYRFQQVDIKFYSFPRNMSGSIVYDFRMIQLEDAIRMDSSMLHEYWPYLIPYNGDEDKDGSFDLSKDTDLFEIPLDIREQYDKDEGSSVVDLI